MLANIYEIKTLNNLLFNEIDIIFKNIPKCIKLEGYNNDGDIAYLSNIYIIDSIYDIKKELGELYDKFQSIYLLQTIEIDSLYYNNMYKLSFDYKNDGNAYILYKL
jgi:hypothetical protein